MKTFNKSIFRTLLMAAMMVMGMGNAQADVIWTGNESNNQIHIDGDSFAIAAEGSTLRITFTINNPWYWSFGVQLDNSNYTPNYFSNWNCENRLEWECFL